MDFRDKLDKVLDIIVEQKFIQRGKTKMRSGPLWPWMKKSSRVYRVASSLYEYIADHVEPNKMDFWGQSGVAIIEIWKDGKKANVVVDSNYVIVRIGNKHVSRIESSVENLESIAKAIDSTFVMDRPKRRKSARRTFTSAQRKWLEDNNFTVLKTKAYKEFPDEPRYDIEVKLEKHTWRELSIVVRKRGARYSAGEIKKIPYDAPPMVLEDAVNYIIWINKGITVFGEIERAADEVLGNEEFYKRLNEALNLTEAVSPDVKDAAREIYDMVYDDASTVARQSTGDMSSEFRKYRNRIMDEPWWEREILSAVDQAIAQIPEEEQEEASDYLLYGEFSPEQAMRNGFRDGWDKRR